MKSQLDFHYLNRFLPNGAFYLLIPYFQNYNIDFVVYKHRKTILGNYIYDPHKKNHKITVNSTLNPYAFLVTTLHEIAHLLTFDKFKNSVQPHGPEWKNLFKQILIPFLHDQIFPKDIETQLLHSINNLKASSCGDLALAKILKKYDPPQNTNPNLIFLEQILPQEKFIYDNREFIMIKKVKKRFLCQEIKTKNQYLFYALCEVFKTATTPNSL